MDDIKQYKIDLDQKLRTLPEARQKELIEYYGKTKIDSVAFQIIADARKDAEDTIRYADRHDYGYGEVGYNLNECIKDFTEDVPELHREYKYLVNAYFDLLTETKNI